MWKPALADLPLNPVASAQVNRPAGVLLTPARFLRRHPNISPREFWDYAWSTEGEQLKTDFNYEIATNVDDKVIIQLARRKRHLLSKYLEDLAQRPKPAYDVYADPDLIVRRADFGIEVAERVADLPAPTTEDKFISFVEAVISNYRNCIEEKGAHSLLWVNDRPRAESHAQKLFHTSAYLSCIDRDIDITPEAETGRGPVDFKLSRGRSLRALVELKLAKSSSFWRTLEYQTPIYSKAEGLRAGYFVVIQYDDKHCSAEFIERVHKLADKVARKNDLDFSVVFVDARPKKSASNVGPGDT